MGVTIEPSSRQSETFFFSILMLEGKSRDRCFVGYEYGFFAFVKGGSGVSTGRHS
jgi:hypothetical protein